MALLGIDLGGTTLRLAVFSGEGNIILRESVNLGGRKGNEVGSLITSQTERILNADDGPNIEAIGVAVPGISHRNTQTVWAPNIPGWEDYPLLYEMKQVVGDVPVTVDCDRACYILGECWKGNAKGCNDAIFLSVGTGIGAGILVDGAVLRGAHDIAGSVGWMALDHPFQEKYIPCGCFEYNASGEGLAKVARELWEEDEDNGILQNKAPEDITARDVFVAYEEREPWAVRVMENAVVYWGMATANLISIFNPEKILFGGGVFGPGIQFMEAIKQEAKKWAQPISMSRVSLEKSALEGDAGIYGAGFLALKSIRPKLSRNELP